MIGIPPSRYAPMRVKWSQRWSRARRSSSSARARCACVVTAVPRMRTGPRSGALRLRRLAAAVGVPPRLRLDARLQVDVLRLLERLEPLLPQLAAEARLLHAAERAGVVVRQRVVEPDRPRPDLAHAAEDRVQVARVDVAAEPEAGRVRELDRLVERAHADDRRDRAERLLAQEVDLGRSAGD